ncbi:hypothetical protein Aperf_G00000021355 [Anoplocephala perfoliata]
MSRLLLLRGKFSRKNSSDPISEQVSSPQGPSKSRSSAGIPPTFFKGSNIIGWNLENDEYRATITINKNTFTISLNETSVRDVQYRILDLRGKEHQVILRISFVTVFEPDNCRRIFVIKAIVNPNFHLCAKDLVSDLMTAAKLVNLTNLGLSFDQWVLHTSILL